MYADILIFVLDLAKRAYLQALSSPPSAIFSSSDTENNAIIRPYDGADAQSIIQSVSTRHNSSASRSHISRSSVSVPNGAVGHSRISSAPGRNGTNIMNEVIPES